MTIQEIMERFFTESEVCQALGLTKNALQARRCRGQDHPPYVKLGRRILFPKDKFDQWIKSQPMQTEIRRPLLHAVK